MNLQLVDANGNTNNISSLVGRDGVFYSDNLMLATGTNGGNGTDGSGFTNIHNFTGGDGGAYDLTPKTGQIIS